MMQYEKILFAAAAFLLAFVAPASTAKDLAPRSAGQRTSEPQAYVATSYLIAPRQAGEFILEGSRYDPSQKYSGAGFRYKVEGQQETRIDVYVYPAGKMARTAALAQGMEGFHADLVRATEAGTYSNVILRQEEEFLLAEPAPMAGSETATDKQDAALLQTIAATARQPGRKLGMSMNLQPQDWPMHSNGYLFYKQLYYFKLRASAAQDRITPAQFNALTDRAARTLIPAMQVVNVGQCADAVIHISVDATPEQAAQALVTQASEHQGYNCHATAQAAGIGKQSADTEIIEISYEPKEWKSE